MASRPPAGRSRVRRAPLVRERGGRRLFFSVAEAAELLAVDEALVLRALTVEDGVFFPGAFVVEGTDEWLIPVADLQRVLGRPVEQLFGVRRFAELIGFAYDPIRKAVRAGRIKHCLVMGEIRVPESEYWRLRKLKKPPAPAALSFFAASTEEDVA